MIDLFRVMSLIRTFEDRVHVLFQDGELPGLLHLCSGQEAGVAGVIAHLQPVDMVTSTHRNHGHGLAKGISPAAMMTELYGRAGGANDGKGGSMHVADASVGLLASGGIVGAGVPLAMGPALAAKLDRRSDVAVTFFGDGAAQQGTVLESMNLAAVWNLPAVFVCENNVFGQATPITYSSAVKPHARAAGFGLPAEIVDGQDVLAVYQAAGQAISRAREGGGPSFLEIRTYSYHGGWEGESKKSYRVPEIEAEFRERDPLEILDVHLRDRLENWGVQREDIEDRVHDMVDAAVEAARRAPRPDPRSLTEGVYADTTVSVDRDGLMAS